MAVSSRRRSLLQTARCVPYQRPGANNVFISGLMLLGANNAYTPGKQAICASVCVCVCVCVRVCLVILAVPHSGLLVILTVYVCMCVCVCVCVCVRVMQLV